MTTQPPHGPDPHGRAGHETDRDYVDTDVPPEHDVERQGDFTDKDVATDTPELEREGDYVDKDVPDDDVDTPPGSYVQKDSST